MALAVCMIILLAVAVAGAASDVMEDIISCSGDQDVSTCLKVSALRLLDHQPGVPQFHTSVRDLGNNASASDLDNLLMEGIYDLLTTTNVSSEHNNDESEGRGRKGYKKVTKGGGVYLAMFGVVGLTLLKLALATLALLAGKALLIAKVALLLAAIFGLKNLLVHHPQEKHAAKVIYAEPEIHGDWARNSLAQESAQELAYRSQRSFHSHLGQQRRSQHKTSQNS